MTVTLEQLQPYINKEAIFHVKQEDGSLREIQGTIMAATVAGVAYKEKSKGMDLISSPSLIEEIDFAPTKPKAVSQKKLKPIEFGNVRQHLVDRHGVELSWAKDADEKAAYEYHEELDHSNLGHVHVAPEEKKDEREEALAS